MTRLTTEALDVLIAEHVERTCCGSPECVTPSWCRCGSSWPCTSPALILATEVRDARPVIEKATGMVHHWADCNCPTMNPQHPEEFDCMYNGQLEAALGHYEVGRTE